MNPRFTQFHTSVHRLAAIIAFVWIVTARAEDPTPPPPPPATLEQRLLVFPLNEQVMRGALPKAADCAVLAREKGVKRFISLLAEDQVPADVKQAAGAAGIAYEFYPLIAAEPAPPDARVDRAKVRALVDQLRSAGAAKAYVHGGAGGNLIGLVNFTYRIEVDKTTYAEALLEAFQRGMVSPQCPGFITDMKLIAAGLDELPVVKPMPLPDTELLSREKRINAAGIKLHVKQQGNGPPLYLLHGGPGESHIMLRPYLDALASSATLVYFDQRGCGFSERPLFREAYSISQLVADLEALRVALGHEKISILAHSSGGPVAAGYALAHRDRVDKLIITSSWASAEEFSRVSALATYLMEPDDLKSFNELMTTLTSQQRDPNDDELGTLQKYVYPAQFFGQLSPEFREDWQRRSRVSSMACQALVNEYMGGPQVPQRLDLRPKLAELKGVPTLVIAGKFDAVTPVQLVRTYADGIPGARFEIMDNCGHYPYVEQHEQYIKLVTEFLASKTGPSAAGG